MNLRATCAALAAASLLFGPISAAQSRKAADKPPAPSPALRSETPQKFVPVMAGLDQIRWAALRANPKG